MAQDSEFENWEQINRRFQRGVELPFSTLLPPEKVARILSEMKITVRERVYPPTVTLWMFLSQVLSSDHSCRNTVARLLAWRSSQGLPPCSADTTSYCEARQRLPLELIKRLVREVACELEEQSEQAWLWKKRPVKPSDGTTVTMPDTDANQAVYPRRRNQAHGVGFPIARVMMVLSLASGTVMDLAIGPMRGKKTGENTLLRTLGGALQKGDVLLVDRLLGSYQEFATNRARGIDVVARLHHSRRTDFRRGRWLGTLDHVVVWHRPKFDRNRFDRATWEALPTTMEVRELRFRVTQPGFRSTEITIATTLLDPVAYPAADLAELYRERWHCELDLRSLKTSMQMAHLRCKTPEMVEKEIWMHCLAYNLIRKVMAESARMHQLQPRHLSFKGAVQTVNSFAPHLDLAVHQTERQRRWDRLLKAIGTHIVGNRPNRIEPRKLKYRVGMYTYMTRPRTEERRRLSG
jgi:hypothetical protein